MNNINDQVRSIGDVTIMVERLGYEEKYLDYQNTVLLTGRRALTKSLANDLTNEGGYDFYITRMLFGDGGTQSGVKKFVDAGRNGLFGTTQVSKPVLANIDSSIPTQAIFTSVIKFDEAVGVVINEMALQMANEDLYSMTTFPDLSKTSDMQITFNWRLNFI